MRDRDARLVDVLERLREDEAIEPRVGDDVRGGEIGDDRRDGIFGIDI